jgi:hypothetical protein
MAASAGPPTLSPAIAIRAAVEVVFGAVLGDPAQDRV